MVPIVLVYKTGGYYKDLDLDALVEQIKYRFGQKPIIFTDDPLVAVRHHHTRPLTWNLPGWWSKMEIFDVAKLGGDFLYMDLDTILVDNCHHLAQPGTEFRILRDFYRPRGMQSSFMYVPNYIRPVLWNTFMKNPRGWMGEFADGGDQAFLEMQLRNYAVRYWQDMVPGQFVSYKATMHGGPVPPEARVVIFHGQPKPRDILWKLDMHLKVTAGSVDTCGPLTTLSAQRSSSTPSTPMASSPSSAAGASE